MYVQLCTCTYVYIYVYSDLIELWMLSLDVSSSWNHSLHCPHAKVIMVLTIHVYTYIHTQCMHSICKVIHLRTYKHNIYTYACTCMYVLVQVQWSHTYTCTCIYMYIWITLPKYMYVHVYPLKEHLHVVHVHVHCTYPVRLSRLR